MHQVWLYATRSEDSFNCKRRPNTASSSEMALKWTFCKFYKNFQQSEIPLIINYLLKSIAYFAKVPVPILAKWKSKQIWKDGLFISNPESHLWGVIQKQPKKVILIGMLQNLEEIKGGFYFKSEMYKKTTEKKRV